MESFGKFVWAKKSPASYVLWSHRLSGFNLNLFAHRISAPFIYLIRWYLLPIRPSYSTNQTTRLNLSGQKSRWKGSELRRLSSPQMNHTLTASRSWQSDALSDVDFHEASDILGYVGFADLDLFEVLDLVILTFTVWVPTTAKRYQEHRVFFTR